MLYFRFRLKEVRKFLEYYNLLLSVQGGKITLTPYQNLNTTATVMYDGYEVQAEILQGTADNMEEFLDATIKTADLKTVLKPKKRFLYALVREDVLVLGTSPLQK